MEDKEKQNISMKEMLTKRSFEPITNYNCKVESRIEPTDKDKIIEEMAKVIDDRLIEARCWLGSMNRGEGYWIAQKLIEHYQPKLPEDSVVLSREELEKKLQLERKETAEKILKDFKLWAREYQYKDTVVDENGERPMTNNEKLNYLYTYLCDKYKVEIKE